jgi:hypothetical protein
LSIFGDVGSREAKDTGAARARPRQFATRCSTFIRFAASAALLGIAVVWPFLPVTSHAPGDVLVDFGGGHGIDLVDLLSLPAIAAAIALSVPRKHRRRPREDELTRTG